MEYIPGQNLDKVWDGLDRAGRDDVVAQLRGYFDELRSLPSPGHYCGVWGQAVNPRLNSIIEGISRRLHAELSPSDLRPVLTHAHLIRNNIRIRDDGTVVLIDWESAGWYPSYLESYLAMILTDDDDGWFD
ncbi:phosphotransferase, partial [Candidatus Bathyarchaeota archaeon]|nr:phosphotransferase [Candidatus Bathyarchaeota archaeon]